MSSGWKNILSGVGVILIGLVLGGSIFTGDADILDWIFDIVGIGLVIYGVFQLVTKSD